MLSESNALIEDAATERTENPMDCHPLKGDSDICAIASLVAS